MGVRILKYVSTSATGTGDGSSGNPWTIAQAVAAANSTMAILVRPGTYTLTANIVSAQNHTLWIGVDGSDNPVDWWDTATLPVLDANSSAYQVQVPAKTNQVFYGLKIINATTTGFAVIGADTNPCHFINCVAENCSAGFSLGNYGRALFCKASSNTTGFTVSGTSPLAYRCVSEDNGTNYSASSKGIILDSVSVDTATNTTMHIAHSSGLGTIVNNSVYGSGAVGTYGITIGATGASVVFNNLLKNIETGVFATGGNSLFANNTANGTTTPFNLSGNYNQEINDVTTDPQFADPTNLDFSIGESAFQRHFSTLNINLGADQSGGAGGGSVFGSLIQV